VGYFPFFEYLIFSRNYALGVLLAFVLCWQLTHRRPINWRIGLTLFLLCQTSIYGCFIAISICLLLVLESRLQLSTLLLFTVGLAIAIAQMVPPSDSGYAVGWITHWDGARIKQAVATFQRAFTLLPPLGERFPGSQWLAVLSDNHRVLLS